MANTDISSLPLNFEVRKESGIAASLSDSPTHLLSFEIRRKDSLRSTTQAMVPVSGVICYFKGLQSDKTHCS